MKIERFEDIVAWQKEGALSHETYRVFGGCNDYAFTNQIKRAVISIMNNIAEGYERKTNNEFKHFLYIAKGSCGEFRSMIYIAAKLNYIDQHVFSEMIKRSAEISRMLSGLIKTL